jgi:hypothetical protein
MAEDRGCQRDERDQLAVQYGVIGIAAVVAAMRYQGTRTDPCSNFEEGSDRLSGQCFHA